jgi:NAD(P)-dependent dehydrogenase (short-subunit alcohol dehydrogenase family)
MKDKVALITGGARGFGAAVARVPGDQGCALFLVDILECDLEQTRDSLVARGIRCEIHVADIALRANCFAAVETAISVYGGIDILCNVAGIGHVSRTTDVSEESWSRLIAVNVGATFFFCQAAIPHLLLSHGNIVNVASQAGVTGLPYLSAYSASKAAVIQMTRSMAVEYADFPIRINVICPGGMATPMLNTPLVEGLDPAKLAQFVGPRGLSQPQEIAEFILFVSWPKASSIHGAVLMADHGLAAG